VIDGYCNGYCKFCEKSLGKNEAWNSHKKSWRHQKAKKIVHKICKYPKNTFYGKWYRKALSAFLLSQKKKEEDF